MHMRMAATLAVISLGLAACGPNADKSDVGLASGAILGGVLGNQFGKGSGRVLGTVAGAVIGGVVGSDVGRQLDDRDRRLAQEAEFDAFERGETGRPRRWRNEGNGRYGEIVPMQRYSRGGYDCRDYTHTVYIDGRPQAMRGTACRNPDGTWRNLG